MLDGMCRCGVSQCATLVPGLRLIVIYIYAACNLHHERQPTRLVAFATAGAGLTTVTSLCNDCFGCQNLSLYEVVLTQRGHCSQNAVIGYHLH